VEVTVVHWDNHPTQHPRWGLSILCIQNYSFHHTFLSILFVVFRPSLGRLELLLCVGVVIIDYRQSLSIDHNLNESLDFLARKPIIFQQRHHSLNDRVLVFFVELGATVDEVLELSIQKSSTKCSI